MSRFPQAMESVVVGPAARGRGGDAVVLVHRIIAGEAWLLDLPNVGVALKQAQCRLAAPSSRHVIIFCHALSVTSWCGPVLPPYCELESLSCPLFWFCVTLSDAFVKELQSRGVEHVLPEQSKTSPPIQLALA